MHPLKWTDRRFELGYPPELFPNVLERLAGTPIRLKAMMPGLAKEVLTRKPVTGWSIQEHVGHLCDLEDLHEGRIDDFIFRTRVLRAADITNRKTHDANHNAAEINVLLDQFTAKRERFVNRLMQLDDETLEFVCIHPRLEKPMRVIDLMVFTAEHDDHHMAWMRSLIPPGHRG